MTTTTKQHDRTGLIFTVLVLFCIMFAGFAIVCFFIKGFMWWGAFCGILAFFSVLLAQGTLGTNGWCDV